MQETQVLSVGPEDPLKKEMATHSNILAWKIPWTEEPGWLHSIGSQRTRHGSLCLCVCVCVCARVHATHSQIGLASSVSPAPFSTHHVSPWTGRMTSLCLDFPICKEGPVCLPRREVHMRGKALAPPTQQRRCQSSRVPSLLSRFQPPPNTLLMTFLIQQQVSAEPALGLGDSVGHVCLP